MTQSAGKTSIDDGSASDSLPYIVVIGGSNIDIHGTPSLKLTLGDSNPGSVQTSPGGVARNVAENLARLGADSRLISVVGNDALGKQLLEHGRSVGIDMQHVLQTDSAPTSSYLSVLDESGDMHVAISDMESISHLTPKVLEHHTQLLGCTEIVVADTNLSESALTWLAENLQEQVLFIDTVSTAKAMRIKPHLEAIHTLKTNLLEAEAISGRAADGGKALSDVARWFHQQGVTRVLVTLGSQGVFYSTGKAQGTQPPPTQQGTIVNANGAGDAFMAGLAYAWLRQWNTDKSIGFAQAAASITLADRQTNSSSLSLEHVTRVYESSYAN